MADTFKVFKKQNRPKFKIEDEPKKKQQRVKVTSKRKSGTPKKRPAVYARAKRTLYEDTVNISSDGKIENSDTEINTSTIEIIKAKKKTGKIVFTVLMSVLIIALLALFALACVNLIFKVESVSCEGVTLYNADDVAAKSGINIGDKMYSVNKKAVSQNLIARFPYFKEVRVVREIPAGIVIRVTEDTAAYYTSFCGEYCLLSKEMRVLEFTDDIKEYKKNNPALIELTLPRVSDAIVGNTIVFFNEDSNTYVDEIIGIILDGETGGKITAINIKSKYDIKYTYDGRMQVLVGSSDGINAKMTFAKNMIDQFDENAKGTVSAQKTDNGYVVLE